MRKVLTSIALLLLLAGCTAQTTSYYLEYHKWVPISQNSSLKNKNHQQGKEVKMPSQK